MVACARCGTENPEGAKFCNECAAPLAAAPPRESRRVVTVLFCDVSGSTELGERLDPERLRGVMSGYFETARRVIERHGGTVEKFIGDAVMAVFGVPRIHEDDALRAMRAALELRDSVGVGLHIGVNTGEVVTGGADTLATGDAVNVAARLEQAAGVGEVLVGAETYRLVRGAVEAELLPPLKAKGKSRPLTIYRLLAVRGERRQASAAMLGRGQELELLERALDRARRESACHLFTVLGTAGIGKSRLVEEFLAGLDGPRVLRGSCLSYGEGITYWPVVGILKQLGALPEEEAIRAPLEALLGVEQSHTTPSEMAWAVRKTLEQAARERPLVVVFDDIQWGEPTFLDLVEHVADLSRGAPILLLCMARPELLDLRPTWAGGKHNATSVLLEPLAAEQTDALVRALLGDEDDALATRIAQSAEGNPLFVEEMVELVRESDGQVAVPPTIQALLAARLDGLPGEERAVLERGAVEGEVFHRGGLAALAPEERQLDARLAGLVRKELVRPDTPTFASDDAYRFRHLLIRDAAYEALPKATRIELHARFADWLAECGYDLVELDEILGYHLEQACRYRWELELPPDEALATRAQAHLAAAGRRALMRDDHAAAAKLLERATAVGHGMRSQVELELDLAEALFYAGRLEDALERCTAAAEQAAAAGDQRAETCCRLRELLTRTWADPEGAAVRLQALANATIPAFEADNDDLGLFLAYNGLGVAAHMHAKHDTALAAFERALQHAQRLGEAYHEQDLLHWISASRMHGATPVAEHLAWLDELERKQIGTLHLRLERVLSDAKVGRFEDARAGMALIRATRAERGDTLMLGEALAFGEVELELLAGNPAAAVAAGIEGCRLLEQTGDRSWLSTAAAELAEALYQLDRLDEADEWATKSRELGATDDAATQMGWRQVRAKILARRGNAATAEQFAREATGIADESDNIDRAGYTYLDLAEVLQLAGNTTAARGAREHALALYERKGDTIMAGRVRSLLAERQITEPAAS